MENPVFQYPPVSKSLNPLRRKGFSDLRSGFHPVSRAGGDIGVIFESDIEEKLVSGIEKRGGLCLKFGMDGWPDRIVILPGQVIWVELKRPTGEVAKLQKWRSAQLKKLGQRVEIPKSKEDVQQFLDSL